MEVASEHLERINPTSFLRTQLWREARATSAHFGCEVSAEGRSTSLWGPLQIRESSFRSRVPLRAEDRAITRRIPSELVTPVAMGVPGQALTTGVGRQLLSRSRGGLLESSQCQPIIVTILKGRHGLYLWVLNGPTEAPRDRASARAPQKISPEAGTVPGLLTVDSAQFLNKCLSQL